MSALTILLVTIAFVLLPTPNITTKYIQVIGVIICSILGIINVDWQVILDSFDSLNKQYYLFLEVITKMRMEEIFFRISMVSIPLLITIAIYRNYRRTKSSIALLNLIISFLLSIAGLMTSITYK